MKPGSATFISGIMACMVLQPAFAVQGGRARETVLHSFGSGTDGKFPDAGLIDRKGILYGTTSAGGSHSDGTVFAVDPTTGSETVIHDFNGIDGQGPQAALIALNGKLYGTTDGGGGNNDGALFSVDPKTGKERVAYSFCSVCGDGTNPESGLVAMNGMLYGTTAYGGKADCQFGCGTVFSFDATTGTEKKLYSFTGSNDGQYPWASLIAVNGTLYGTTLAGGTSGNGTVFAVDPNTGAESVVHSFGSGTDSQEPEGSLAAVKGVLYGVTAFGGADGLGTVYSLDPLTGEAKVLHSFCGKKCLDGANPYAGLIDVNGILYGTTSQDGRARYGTVFAVDPATGAERVVYSFSGSDGQQPVGSLIHVNGTFYGTSSQGGGQRDGTVFALTKR